MITVRAGTTQDVKLTLVAKDNIQGTNLFSVKLLENGQCEISAVFVPPGLTP